MQAKYGLDMACDLQPECRYDEVVSALGGGGELVTDPEEVGRRSTAPSRRRPLRRRRRHRPHRRLPWQEQPLLIIECFYLKGFVRGGPARDPPRSRRRQRERRSQSPLDAHRQLAGAAIASTPPPYPEAIPADASRRTPTRGRGSRRAGAAQVGPEPQGRRIAGRSRWRRRRSAPAGSGATRTTPPGLEEVDRHPLRAQVRLGRRRGGMVTRSRRSCGDSRPDRSVPCGAAPHEALRAG